MGVEVEIEIGAGATEVDQNLRDLNVRRLAIEAGTSDIGVHLPTNVRMMDVDISGGVLNVELVVPHNVAAHIEIGAPLGSVRVDPHRYVHTGGIYQSPCYSRARNRVNIDIEALPADVTVR